MQLEIKGGFHNKNVMRSGMGNRLSSTVKKETKPAWVVKRTTVRETLYVFFPHLLREPVFNV